MRKLKRDSRTLKVLRVIAISGAIAISLTSPYAGEQLARELLKHYFSKKRFNRSAFTQDMRRLQQRKLIGYKENPDKTISLAITRRGKEAVLRFDVDAITLKRPPRWDTIWRMILFDIPEAQKKARDAFREKLKDLHCYALQQSVYITPYPCEDEIDFLATFFEVRNHVLLIPLRAFEGDAQLKNYFNV